MEEFIEGKFFSGELFLDLEKKAYAKLGFQRMSMKEIFSAIFSRKSRLASNKAKEYELGGNMKGDGYQNGGCLVVQAVNGKALYTYRQEHAADHPENTDILDSLGLEQN